MTKFEQMRQDAREAMEIVQDDIILAYDEAITVDQALEYLRTDIANAKSARDKFFLTFPENTLDDQEPTACQLTTLEQMGIWYQVFCEDLLQDGLEGTPVQFIEVMWEWKVDEGYRLEDEALAIQFLQAHKVDPITMADLLAWMRKFK